MYSGHSDLASVVRDMHCGSTLDYVTCCNCNQGSSRHMPFYGISLDIERANSLHQAFQAYIQPETLQGSNQYMCQHCASKQNARKGIAFVHLDGGFF